MPADPRLETNRRNWNERTPVHAASDFYDIEGFRNGCITLSELERSGVGDVHGKSLLHLQCHFGMDTLSWARLGADATGVDISDEAVALARELNDELGLGARFIRSDVLTLPTGSTRPSTSSTRPWACWRGCPISRSGQASWPTT